jgi:hypothetical protein
MKVGLFGLVVCLFEVFSILFVPTVARAQAGHQAGYDWAEKKGIDDPDHCRSREIGRWDDDNINNSPSFTAGCLEFLHDNNLADDDDELSSKDKDDDADDSDDEDDD